MSKPQRHKFRSDYELSVAKYLAEQGVKYEYEAHKLVYYPKPKVYIPDFYLPDNDIYIEAKGFFRPSDRRKMLAVKEQHPELDIRFVFMRNNLLSKNSKSTYGDWAEKHGFQWCIYPNIPPDWFQ